MILKKIFFVAQNMSNRLSLSWHLRKIDKKGIFPLLSTIEVDKYESKKIDEKALSQTGQKRICVNFCEALKVGDCRLNLH